jgi:hypothetical protein
MRVGKVIENVKTVGDLEHTQCIGEFVSVPKCFQAARL